MHKTLYDLGVAFVADTRGDTAVQYALIASLISVFLLSAYLAVGNAQTRAFEAWSTAVSNAIED